MAVDRTCVICGGMMGKTPGDICCRDEDQFLLIKCKGHMRSFEGRQCTVEGVVVKLYDDLAEFLETRADDISNYDEEGVMLEIERRVLRWVEKEMIDYKTMKGIGYCSVCGVPLLAGRNKCTNCSSASSVKGAVSPAPAGGGAKIPRGMHTRR